METRTCAAVRCTCVLVCMLHVCKSNSRCEFHVCKGLHTTPERTHSNRCINWKTILPANVGYTVGLSSKKLEQ